MPWLGLHGREHDDLRVGCPQQPDVRRLAQRCHGSDDGGVADEGGHGRARHARQPGRQQDELLLRRGRQHHLRRGHGHRRRYDDHGLQPVHSYVWRFKGGQKCSVTDARGGKKTSFTYDAKGNLTKVTPPAPQARPRSPTTTRAPGRRQGRPRHPDRLRLRRPRPRHQGLLHQRHRPVRLRRRRQHDLAQGRHR